EHALRSNQREGFDGDRAFVGGRDDGPRGHAGHDGAGRTSQIDMTRLSTPLLFAFLCVALATSGRSPFAGTWSAKINDLPGVDLMIEEAGGKIGGTVTFYFQTRGEDGKWHVADKTTV